MILAAIHKLVGHGVVETFGIFFGQILGENIVSRRSEAVRAHSAVVAVFVSRLTRRGKSHDDVAQADSGIVDDFRAFHTARNRRIDDNRAHEVAHIRRFAASRIDSDAHFAQFGEQFVGAVDDGGNDLAWNQQFIASDGRTDEDVVRRAHAEQVVGVHHDGILSNAFPYAQIARFAPVHVGQRRLRSGTVGVHDVAIVGVAAENIGDNLAKCLWIKALVDVFNGGVDVFFCG